MPSQVLARKWRPQNFEMLVGQQHVLQALVNALKQQRLHHAYLFTGTRGVGKTTLARILAKCLNCEKGVTAEPCGQCQNCQDIENGRFVDLLEIDAASKTKVEDTREILDNVMYAPSQGRCKIYLIDEVHMLSGHSFNALLKTLEEPPAHVKFLLATTDPQKLPITILSRCLQFHLKQLHAEQIAPHLSYILEQEKIPFDPKALDLVAHAANGSMRDGLSLLDQAIAYCAGQVNEAAVSDMLGIQGRQYLIPLAEAIFTRQIDQALRITQQLAEVSSDFDFVLAELIHLIHDVAIKQKAPQLQLNSLNWNDEALTALVKQADAKDLQLYYQIALLAKRDLPLATTPQIGFEMALLRMVAFSVEDKATIATSAARPAAPNVAPAHTANVAAPVNPIKNAPKAATAIATPKTAIASQTPPWQETPIAPPVATVVSSTAAASAHTPISIQDMTPDTWLTIVPHLGLTAMTKALAEHLSFEYYQEQHFYFSLLEQYAKSLQERHRQNIAQALTDYFKLPVNITIQIGQSKHKNASLVEHKQQVHQEKTEKTLQAFQEDPKLQAVLKQFGGSLVPESLNLHEEE